MKPTLVVWYIALIWLGAWIIGCGSVTSSELGTDGAGADSGPELVQTVDAAAPDTSAENQSDAAAPLDGPAPSPDVRPTCTGATVALTAGDRVCDCGGTCGGCPIADAPTCGGTGLGHPNWTGCTVGGVPYIGCAQGTYQGQAVIGYCCRNDCSLALCAP